MMRFVFSRVGSWLLMGCLLTGYTYAQPTPRQPAPVYASVKTAEVHRPETPKYANAKSAADIKAENKKSRKLIGRCWSRLMATVRELNVSHRSKKQ